MATIDDVARSLGKDVKDVGMLDLMKAGMSGTDAMQAVGEAATRKKDYPVGFKPPIRTDPTPAAAKLGLDTLGKAILEGSIAPSKGLVDHLEGLLGFTPKTKPPSGQVSIPEKDWVPTQKAPVYSNQPAAPLPGQVLTPPAVAPALGTGTLVAAGLGLLLILLFTGRR